MEPTLPYIAGFFDGEGCVGIYTADKGQHYLKVQLTQNESPEALYLFGKLCSLFGGATSRQLTKTGRTKLNWQVSSAKAAVFLNAVMPFLVMKAEQARVAVGWETSRPKATRGPGGWLVRDPDPQDALAAQLLKDLKKACPAPR